MTNFLKIEFVGLPGSGKSTIAKKLGAKINVKQKYELIAHEFGKNNLNNYLNFFMSFHRFVGKPLRLYDAWSYEMLKNNSLMQSELNSVLKNYYDFLASESEDYSQLPLIMRSLERDLIFNLLCTKENINYINEDGISQRLVSIFGLRFNNWILNKAKLFQNDVAFLLKNNIVVVVNCSAELALERIKSRRTGAPELLHENELTLRINRAEEYLKYLHDHYKSNNIRILSIDSEAPINSSVQSLVRELT